MLFYILRCHLAIIPAAMAESFGVTYLNVLRERATMDVPWRRHNRFRFDSTTMYAAR